MTAIDFEDPITEATIIALSCWVMAVVLNFFLKKKLKNIDTIINDKKSGQQIVDGPFRTPVWMPDDQWVIALLYSRRMLFWIGVSFVIFSAYLSDWK